MVWIQVSLIAEQQKAILEPVSYLKYEDGLGFWFQNVQTIFFPGGFCVPPNDNGNSFWMADIAQQMLAYIICFC